MKKILVIFFILIIIFIIGCSKEEIVEEVKEHPGKITAYTYKIDEIEKDDFVEEDIPSTVRLCHDTDNGIVRWKNGSIYGFYDNAKRFEFNDYCFDKNIVIEYYCENETPQNRSFICKSGCVDSHCI